MPGKRVSPNRKRHQLELPALTSSMLSLSETNVGNNLLSSTQRKKRSATSKHRTPRVQPELHCSPALSHFLGNSGRDVTLTRGEAVSRVWAYAKEKGLQAPNDGRTILCDATMRDVFGKRELNFSTLASALAPHLRGTPFAAVASDLPSSSSSSETSVRSDDESLMVASKALTAFLRTHAPIFAGACPVWPPPAAGHQGGPTAAVRLILSARRASAILRRYAVTAGLVTVHSTKVTLDGPRVTLDGPLAGLFPGQSSVVRKEVKTLLRRGHLKSLDWYRHLGTADAVPSSSSSSSSVSSASVLPRGDTRVPSSRSVTSRGASMVAALRPQQGFGFSCAIGPTSLVAGATSSALPRQFGLTSSHAASFRSTTPLSEPSSSSDKVTRGQKSEDVENKWHGEISNEDVGAAESSDDDEGNGKMAALRNRIAKRRRRPVISDDSDDEDDEDVLQNTFPRVEVGVPVNPSMVQARLSAFPLPSSSTSMRPTSSSSSLSSSPSSFSSAPSVPLPVPLAEVHHHSTLFDADEDLNLSAQYPSEFLCPITLCPMKDPVIAADGHSYERSALETWLKRSRRSPKVFVYVASSGSLSFLSFLSLL